MLTSGGVAGAVVLAGCCNVGACCAALRYLVAIEIAHTYTVDVGVNGDYKCWTHRHVPHSSDIVHTTGSLSPRFHSVLHTARSHLEHCSKAFETCRIYCSSSELQLRLLQAADGQTTLSELLECEAENWEVDGPDDMAELRSTVAAAMEVLFHKRLVTL